MSSNNQNRVVKIFTNGKPANDAYGLSKLVGQVVKRADVAKQRAVVSTSRKAVPLAKALITAPYNVKASLLSDKIRTRITSDTLSVDASRARFPLIGFSGSWIGTASPGATASIIRGRTKTYAGSWIHSIQGLTSIRVRKGPPRGPVAILRGPSPKEMILGPEFPIAAKLTQQLVDFYVTELRRQYTLQGNSSG